MRLTSLALKFLRIGATGFGGPMALIGLMEHHLVQKAKAVTPEEFAEGVAIGQILPGPVAVDCATHIGYRLHGVVGALVSVGALILPPFLLMLAITPLYLAYGRVPEAQGFFRGVGPAVVAVILVAAWRLSKRFVGDWRAGVIAGAAAVGILFKANPILIIVEAGLLGLLLAPRGKGGAKQ